MPSFIRTVSALVSLLIILLIDIPIVWGFEKPHPNFLPRWGASSGVLPDGKVIISGGFDGKDTGRT